MQTGSPFFFETEPEREERIQQEIILDADGDEAIAACWYKYLSKNLNFPFLAMVQTHKKRNPSGGMGYSSSPVRLLGMAPLARCTTQQMWAIGVPYIGSGKTPFHFLLTDLQSIDADKSREQALSDWMYWNRNHDFGLCELKG